MSDQKEYILCAAIYVDDGIEHNFSSYNHPKTGLLFCGHRHADCFPAMNAWADTLSGKTQKKIEEILPDQLSGRNQGFLTSTGRFVNREEGAKIAFVAGQINKRKETLFSEDLY